MKKLSSHSIGVDQGDSILFSDYQDGGAMWTGSGPRARRQQVLFSARYAEPPVVHCALSMWDMDKAGNQRADVTAEAVTETGFDIVFRTWGDTRVARARVRWMAIGTLPSDDDWEV